MTRQNVLCHRAMVNQMNFRVIGTKTVTVAIDINNIWKWCEKNLMALNVQKSLVLLTKAQQDIILSENKLGISSEMNDLGLNVSQTLTWSSHA